jgi:rsbT co-antagonist protein RsbR
MGATVIVTGLSADVAQSLVALGIDLGKLRTIGDLQGGLEEAELILGHQVAQKPGFTNGLRPNAS